MVVKDGYRFIQGLLPARMHKDFTELSRKLGKSRSETLRNAIDTFLKNKYHKDEGAKEALPCPQK